MRKWVTCSTQGSGTLLQCLLLACWPPAACLLLAVLLLQGAACCCQVLLPQIAAGLLIACWLHSCDFSWRVLLLALGQTLLEPLPAQGLLSAACGPLLVACCLLAEASCRLLSASACCFGFGLLEIPVSVLDREERLALSWFFGVVCGQSTVAAWCEIKTGSEWGSLTYFGSRGTRNAVAPPFGMLDSGARFRAHKAAQNLGPCASHPTE